MFTDFSVILSLTFNLILLLSENIVYITVSSLKCVKINDPKYDHSVWVNFHVHLKKMYILPLLDRVFCKYQLNLNTCRVPFCFFTLSFFLCIVFF